MNQEETHVDKSLEDHKFQTSLFFLEIDEIHI